ncbi:AarF/ABC1/UbiB kinase family protein [Ornithinimicrobium sp. Arc0846-15]|nr:AarF/ABC1/UbiB kinase family protein [Ornithinimicrobium laminariae]
MPPAHSRSVTTSQLRARYWRIVFFFARVTASFIWFEIVLRRLKLGGFVARTRAQRTRKAAARFRVLAISMGGLMIKVGQFLSARLDVLPPEVIKELADLQDEVPPEEFLAVQAVAESELALPLSKQFASFDPVPLAAASLGQVHRATLLAGDAAEIGFTDVVVKVQRPDIQQIIEVDLSALRTVGGWLERYRPIRDRADIRALIEEFAKTTLEEVDYLEEAVNLDTFADNFAQDPRVGTPAVLWELSGRRLLTLQDVSAIKLTNRDAVMAAGIDPVQVAQVLADTFLQQILTDGFFHADPHPGNIFVTPCPDSPAGDPDWRMTFIDFGMFGQVPEELRAGLRDLLIAAGLRDSSRFVAGLQRLDLLLPSADLWQIESAAEQVFDRFGGLRIDELQQIDPEELIRFGLQFRELLLELPFQVPKDLLLLGRAVGILSGNCTALDPEFDIWATITPYATQLLDEERSGLSETVKKEAIELGRLALTLPRRADRVLTLAERGQLTVQMPALSQQFARLQRSAARTNGLLVFSALLVSGAILSSVDKGIGPWLIGLSVIPAMWSLALGLRRS